MSDFPRSNNAAAGSRACFLAGRVVFAAIAKLLCIILALLFVITPALPAQQPDQSAAPVPPQIASAHRIFVSNGGGSNYFDAFTGGADRAYNSFYADLLQSSQYELAQVTGQPLSAEQVKAVKNNSGTSTAMKVFFVAGIVSSIGFTALVIHRRRIRQRCRSRRCRRCHPDLAQYGKPVSRV